MSFENDGDLLSQAAELNKSATEYLDNKYGDGIKSDMLKIYQTDILKYRTQIAETDFKAARSDSLTKKTILEMLDKILQRINGLLTSGVGLGGKRSRKSRRSRRSRRKSRKSKRKRSRRSSRRRHKSKRSH
jgi:hypothetical protein